jgi:hypothetical protein
MKKQEEVLSELSAEDEGLDIIILSNYLKLKLCIQP